MPALLYGLCFLSGFAALVFEHVFFRKTGLVFGNGVWATSLVLASFMAGLAVGGLWAARYAERVRNPLRGYAAAEAVVALSGAAVVLAAPLLGTWLGPALGHFLDRPVLINVLRLASAFALLCVPTTAMGTTLPFLARAGELVDPRFGVVLGRLYGWNTLGGMAGAVAGELVLYTWVGVRTTGLVASAFCLCAAGLAFWLARGASAPAADEAPTTAGASHAPRRLLAAAAVSGAALLALEVVWARFFQLFVPGTSLMFAALLAIVLAGIGAGGLLASLLTSRWPEAPGWSAPIALAAGFWVAGGYAWLRGVPAMTRSSGSWEAVLLLSLAFAFPVAFASGILFPLMGAGLRRSGSAARSAGLLTFANTLGALCGGLLGGFVLLPRLGMERSFLVAAVMYGAVALILGGAVWRRPLTWGLTALWLATIALFPFGLMKRVYLARPLEFLYGGGHLAALREGQTETIVYVEARIQDLPYEHRLITNNFSMATTSYVGRRYMKAYTYLPVALHPAPRRALLISYGLGSTAKALTDTRELESIDVVDISRDVLELSSIVYPDPKTHPLRDPRVTVHIEDGRYFLHSTATRYDLITAEPPPPKMAGVVNLYSLEFFRLAWEKLAPGGFVSYWLPLHLMEREDARTITAAFCGAFPDCTLWKGMGLSWMLMGTRDATGPVGLDRFTAQWRDPVAAPELRATGFERPEQLGALFVADASDLASFIQGKPPLQDDFPHRLLPDIEGTLPSQGAAPRETRWYVPMGDVAACQRRFEASDWIARHWPAEMRGATAPYFEWQATYDRIQEWDRTNGLPDFDRVLTGSTLETLPLVLIGSAPEIQSIAARLRAAGNDSRFVWSQEGKARLARRDYVGAAASFEGALARGEGAPAAETLRLRAYALARAGRAEAARAALAQWSAHAGPADAPNLEYVSRLIR